MSNVVTVAKQWVDNEAIHVVGSIALSGSYASGGETPSWVDVKSSKDPLYVTVDGIAGYIYKYNPTTKKIMVFRSAGFTPAGTISAPTFTGSALAAHRHVLHFETSAAANAVTAAANQLRTAAAAFDVAGVADSAGEGGVVDASAGTPAGTISAPTFTGTAVAAGALVELSAASYPAGVSGDTISFHAMFPKV